jgi:hypothetical protein
MPELDEDSTLPPAIPPIIDPRQYEDYPAARVAFLVPSPSNSRTAAGAAGGRVGGGSSGVHDVL